MRILMPLCAVALMLLSPVAPAQEHERGVTLIPFGVVRQQELIHNLVDDSGIQRPTRGPIPEDLFLVYAINGIYERWPAPSAAGRSLEDQLAELNTLSSVIRKRAWALGSTELGMLADSQGRLIDMYEEFLLSQGLIDEAAAADSKSRGAITLVGVGIGAVRAVASKHPIGLAIDIVIGLVDNLISTNRIQGARAELLRREESRLVRELEAQSTYFTTIVNKLREAHGWDPSHVNFSADAVRPIDPLSVHATAQRSFAGADHKKLARKMEDCLYAASLVPPNSAYDPWRTALLTASASYVEQVSLQHWHQTGYSYGGPITSRAAAIAQLRWEGHHDPTCRGRYAWALAMHFDGHHERAYDLLAPLMTADSSPAKFRTDNSVAYNLACMASMSGRHDEAMRWLNHAIAHGDSSISWMKKDPELEPTRRARAEAFKEMTAVKWTHEIETWLLVSSDFKLFNKSAFPLHDVKLIGRVVLKDGQSHPFELTTPEIKPGDHHKWLGALPMFRQADIDRVEYDEASCAQTR